MFNQYSIDSTPNKNTTPQKSFMFSVGSFHPCLETQVLDPNTSLQDGYKYKKMYVCPSGAIILSFPEFSKFFNMAIISISGNSCFIA